MDARQQITKNLELVLKKMGVKDVFPEVKISPNLANGDYFTSLPLKLSSTLKKSPLDIANEIKFEFDEMLKQVKHDNIVTRIDVVNPGFINFFLARNVLQENLVNILEQKETFGSSKKSNDKKIIVEFAHPNTHKEFHIGHLRNITTGEAICRLIESQGTELARVNYEGDVGMHVAKALFGIKSLGIDIEKSKKLKPLEKAELLGKAYAAGSKLYEEDEAAKKEIGIINKQIYARDEKVLELWETTRKWSLEYFDSVYKRVGTKFDRLFFESEVFESGKKIVLEHVDDGIFEESAGAVIFPGEKYGLHNRVFVTGEGNPTYEGKEMGLAPLQYKEFKFDEAIHVVGPEQAGYFEVVFKALELLNPAFIGKEKHLPYGFVQLKDGKMSSRLGNIIRGEWLLDEAVTQIGKSFSDMDKSTAEKVAVGAVKYSMLKVGRTSDIQFSFDESISLEGNSGPYIQYAYVRTQSVITKAKAAIEGKTQGESLSLEKEEENLLRLLMHFPEIVENAATTFSPNVVCNYLFEVSQAFSTFYQANPILAAENEDVKTFRLSLTAATGQIIKNGLNLLGIETVEKM